MGKIDDDKDKKEDSGKIVPSVQKVKRQRKLSERKKKDRKTTTIVDDMGVRFNFCFF